MKEKLPSDQNRPRSVLCQFQKDLRESEEREGCVDFAGESRFSPLPGAVHRYPDRLLILVTDCCFVHCRYCFRRWFVDSGRGKLTHEEVVGIAEYARKRPDIREIILSGGDPLTLTDRELQRVLETLREDQPTERNFRLATRAVTVEPSRVTPELLFVLTRHQPLWCLMHINHPQELTLPVREAMGRLAGNGIPLLAQTVLLKGVNDSADTLEKLFETLISLRVRPYYLFDLDPAEGNAHFRVPLERGIEIMAVLQQRMSSLFLPRYAKEEPDGGGKKILV